LGFFSPNNKTIKQKKTKIIKLIFKILPLMFIFSEKIDY